MDLPEFTGGTPASKPWARVVFNDIQTGTATADILNATSIIASSVRGTSIVATGQLVCNFPQQRFYDPASGIQLPQACWVLMAGSGLATLTPPDGVGFNASPDASAAKYGLGFTKQQLGAGSTFELEVSYRVAAVANTNLRFYLAFNGAGYLQSGDAQQVLAGRTNNVRARFTVQIAYVNVETNTFYYTATSQVSNQDAASLGYAQTTTLSSSAALESYSFGAATSVLFGINAIANGGATTWQRESMLIRQVA